MLLVVPSCVHSRSSPLDSMLLAAHAPALAALQSSALAAPSSCLLICVVGFLRVVIFNALVLSTELYGIGKQIPVALQCNILLCLLLLCSCVAVQWSCPTELYGIGKYAADAYYIFCRWAGQEWMRVSVFSAICRLSAGRCCNVCHNGRTLWVPLRLSVAQAAQSS